jgi:hypothetical protein
MDKCLNQSYINNDEGSDVFDLCLGNWLGIIGGECSARYLSTELLGSIQIRFTLAGTNVLIPKRRGQNIETLIPDSATAAVVNAKNISYELNNVYFTISSVVPPVSYNMMLRSHLEEQGQITLHFKNYYSYVQDGITGNDSTVSPANNVSTTIRFSLSSQSIDKIHCVMRNSSYNTTGAPALKFVNAVGETYTSNYTRFRAYNGTDSTSSPPVLGSVPVVVYRTINNIRYPQYDQNLLESLYNTFYVQDRLSSGKHGNLIPSQNTYFDGMFVDPLILNIESSELKYSLKSGYDSRGVNTFITSTMQNCQVPPKGSDSLTPNSGTLSYYVLAECTSSLVIGLGKSVAVSY